MTRPDEKVPQAALAAAVDTVVPVDEWPAGWEGGVAALVELEPEIVARGWELHWGSTPYVGSISTSGRS